MSSMSSVFPERISQLRSLGIVLLASAALIVPSISYAYFWKGDDLKEFSDAVGRIDGGAPLDSDWPKAEELSGFVLGVSDTLDHTVVCLPGTVTVRLLVGSVRKYVNEHPAEWDKPAYVVVTNALTSSYPCKKP